MPPLSRVSVAAWSAAVVAAVLPTWWYRRESVIEPEYVGLDDYGDLVYGLVRQFGHTRPTPILGQLLDDAGTVVMTAYVWAIPAALVLAGFLGCIRQRDPEAVARRVAWGLVAVAVAGPAGSVDWKLPVLGWEWITAFGGGWGPAQSCYLAAAALVLIFPLGSPRPGPASGVSVLRAAALLADYVIFTTALGLLMPLFSACGLFETGALLSWLRPGTLPVDDDLVMLGLLFLYAWLPRGTTPGKWLVGLRVEGAGWGKAALRALLFPVAVLWPEYGLLWLAADVLWWYADGRTLHDRLLGTTVRAR